MPAAKRKPSQRTLAHMPLADLLPAKRNAKAHDPDLVAASLDRFGYLEPVLLDERTGRLVHGHGRTEVLADAEAAGLAPPEGVQVDPVTGIWLVPVVRGWASRNDDEAHAAGIALNQATMAPGWQPEALASLLEDLAAKPTGLTGTGFTDDSLADLLASHGAPPSLDDLAGRLGEPADDDFWPVLRFKVPPDVAERWAEHVAGHNTEGEALRHLLEAQP